MSPDEAQYTVYAALERSCRWHADRELIVDDAERYSGARLLAEAERAAVGLSRLGIGPGDRVAFVGIASCRFYAVYLAAHRLGGVTCNMHVRESAGFIAQTLRKIEARAIVCSAAALDTALAANADLPEPLPVLLLDGLDRRADSRYDELAADPGALAPAAPVRPDDEAIIILSSGSTGTPKGIVHSQRSFVRWMRGAPALFGAVSRNTRFLVNVGTSFAAWPFSSVPILYHGGTLILLEGFEPHRFCAAVERERVTMAGPVPTMIRMLGPDVTGGYDLSSFEMVLIAGEPPTQNDIDRVLSWADTDIRCLYLASESAPCAGTYWELRDATERGQPVCAGKPVPGADVRIVDPDGPVDAALPPGEQGEIALSGPSLSLGYLGQEELTQQRFVDGWWRSGDIGHIDANGYLFVGGRVDNVINTGGIKVLGEEVETTLLRHPDVSQAAVIGVPDEKWGQRIEAHLALARPIEESELRAHCESSGLARFKHPKRYHVHEALPVGTTGKLDRVSLRRSGGD